METGYAEAKKWKNRFFWTLFIAMLLLFFLGLYWALDSRDERERDALEVSLNDTIKIWKDKDGKNRARISVLETRDTDDFLDVKTNNPEVKQLQADVKKNKKHLKNQGSVTNFSTETEVEVEVPTIVEKDSTGNPVYKSEFKITGEFQNNPNYIWSEGNVEARVDTTKIHYKNIDAYTVVIGEESQGFLGLGKPKPFVDVTNYNPNSKTKTLRAFQVDSPRVKNIHIGPTASYGIGSEFKPQFFIGIGVNYSLISL